MIPRCRRPLCLCHDKLVRLITKQQIYTSLESKAQAAMQKKINLHLQTTQRCLASSELKASKPIR